MHRFTVFYVLQSSSFSFSFLLFVLLFSKLTFWFFFFFASDVSLPLAEWTMNRNLHVYVSQRSPRQVGLANILKFILARKRHRWFIVTGCVNRTAEIHGNSYLSYIFAGNLGVGRQCVPYEAKYSLLTYKPNLKQNPFYVNYDANETNSYFYKKKKKQSRMRMRHGFYCRRYTNLIDYELYEFERIF